MSDLVTDITPKTEDTPLLTITDKAREEIVKVMQDQDLPEGAGLRIGVKGGGCSGFSYVMGFDAAPTEFDEVVEVQEGFKLFIDKKSRIYLEGTVLNYISTIQQKGFVFENPNATGTCGCGNSFSV